MLWQLDSYTARRISPLFIERDVPNLKVSPINRFDEGDVRSFESRSDEPSQSDASVRCHDAAENQ
ncbi:hypothetical protein AWB78_07343 [Caballeronia calidae]|uniref:Uncharacterized protein n=1 Tax=Caballeronia calidae TaxID=1777139 RepID=A0A158EE71_9BURK|nr:hypothetical protein AWB78_07343 [Caballeronia calidae]